MNSQRAVYIHEFEHSKVLYPKPVHLKVILHVPNRVRQRAFPRTWTRHCYERQLSAPLIKADNSLMDELKSTLLSPQNASNSILRL